MTEIQDQNSEVQEVAPLGEPQVNEVKETQQSNQEPVTNQHLKAMRLKNAELERELKQLRENQMAIMQAQLANAPSARQEPMSLIRSAMKSSLTLVRSRS